MSTALTVFIWVISAVIGLPFAAFCIALTVGLVKGINLYWKEKRKEGNA